MNSTNMVPLVNFLIVFIFCVLNSLEVSGQNFRFTEPNSRSRFGPSQRNGIRGVPLSQQETQTHQNAPWSNSNVGISDRGRRRSQNGRRTTEIGFQQPMSRDFRPVESRNSFSSPRSSRPLSRQPSNNRRQEIVIEFNGQRPVSNSNSRILSNTRASNMFSRRSQATVSDNMFRDNFRQENTRQTDFSHASGIGSAGDLNAFDRSGRFDNGKSADSLGALSNFQGNIGNNPSISDNRVGNGLSGLDKLASDNNAISLLTELLKGLNSKSNQPQVPGTAASQAGVNNGLLPHEVTMSAAKSPKVVDAPLQSQVPAHVALAQGQTNPPDPQAPTGGNTVVIQASQPSSNNQTPLVNTQTVIAQRRPSLAHDFGHMYQRESADAPELEEILMQRFLNEIRTPGFAL